MIGTDRRDRVLETLRAVNAAVIEATSRPAIERGACEALVDGAYDGAWLVDPVAPEDAPLVRVGDGGEVPTEVVDEAADGVRLGDVVRDVGESYVAVSCPHDGTTEAILLVRSDTFEEAERPLLIEIGETIGHALASIRRKTALMNETVVELEMRISNATDPIFERHETDATFEFVRTVPIDDDAYLQYVSVEGMAPETFEAEMATYDRVDRLRLVGSQGGRALFETRYRGPSILATVASAGGRVTESHIENGNHYLVARLPDERAVETVVAAVTDRFPDAEVVAQRSLADSPGAAEVRTAAIDRLTDRQRTAIETAFVAGYFDRPRRSTGEELADSLEISPSTFYQHLRAGQRKVFEILFGE